MKPSRRFPFQRSGNSWNRLTLATAWLFAAVLALALLPWERASLAHPVSQNALDVEIATNKITFRMRVATEEVFVTSALAAPGHAKDNPFTDVWRKHAEYLLKHFHISADGQVLTGRLLNLTEPGGVSPAANATGVSPQTSGNRPVPDERGAAAADSETPNDRVIYDFEYVTASPPAKVHIQQDVLREFEYAPGNPWEATYVVHIGQSERRYAEWLLLTFKEPIDFSCQWNADDDGKESCGPRPDQWRMVGQYLRHGIMHILSGYDHLLFIGALVLATVTLWDLIKVVTAFTLAHTITLTLAVLNLVRLPSNVVEPMIAASIVFVAVQNVFCPKQTRGWSRLAIAFFFGLFHGLGFAGGLLSAMEGMAGMTVGLAILAFSVGVEVGHQIVVLPVFFALKLARATQPNEAGRNRISARALRYGSVVLSIAGMIYLFVALR